MPNHLHGIKVICAFRCLRELMELNVVTSWRIRSNVNDYGMPLLA